MGEMVEQTMFGGFIGTQMGACIDRLHSGFEKRLRRVNEIGVLILVTCARVWENDAR